MSDDFWPVVRGVIQSQELGRVDVMVSKDWIGVGDKAIQNIDLWASGVTNEATSGADLIVPPGA